MADILRLIAALEWLALGIYVFWCSRKCDKRLEAATDELLKKLKEYDV